MSRPVIQWAAGAVIGLLAACSSAPELPNAIQLQEGEQVRVRVFQQGSADLGLRTQDNASLDEIYSSPDADPGTKVLERDYLEVLLNLFHSEGFFERSSPGPAPGTEVNAIEVVRNGETLHWLRPDPKRSPTTYDVEHHKAYNACFGYFTNAYNAPRTFYSMNVSSEEVQRRDQARVEEAKARAEARKRGMNHP